MGRFSQIQNLPAARRCLYAVLLENGIVKVGLTKNPLMRIRGLQTETRRHFGADIRRVLVGNEIPGPSLLFRAEAELLNGLGRIARADERYREYFHGLDYTVAVVLLEQITCRFREVDIAKSAQRSLPRADPSPSHSPRARAAELSIGTAVMAN